jgi:hypothetical protein
VLVPPADPPALAAALAVLICDPEKRAALGTAGESRVRGAFDLQTGLDVLAARFGLTVPADAATETSRAA